MNLLMRKITIVLTLFSSLVLAAENYSPYIGQSYPTNVYWGDTHLHTNLSLDAFSRGNRVLGLDEAYRFAKGDSITAYNGMQVQLRRPLDFLVAADHAFNMGVMIGLEKANPALLETAAGRRLYAQYKNIPIKTEHNTKSVIIHEVVDDLKLWIWKRNEAINNDYLHSVWQQVTASADRHSDPGNFTAFIGYEWSSGGAGDSQGNLHRVVIFKDSADKANQIVPFSVFDGYDPEDLWRWFEDYQNKTGGDVLAIPHNANSSNGEMFSLGDLEDRPITQAYASTRSRWEPLFEVTQVKGDGESHPALSPNDEFADYEIWGDGDVSLGVGAKKSDWIARKKSSYARSALKLGLGQQATLGVNPFKFGLIGSTDSHTSLATADDDNFWGKFSSDEPDAERLLKVLWRGSNVMSWEVAASGYAGVWAKENTREALFAAMKRKEVYATTGPRIIVRFFGGWEYDMDDALKPDFARLGYSKGVPMGGDLTNAPINKSPRFLIRAIKDPDGANLDRVQVIKGWRDKDGELHEKIHHVALSDNRTVRQNGEIKPVGSTVDVKDASYTNSIGDPELAIVWQDPDFDKDELAFYYLRVLQIPTPRWTAYDAKFFGIKDIPKEVTMITQERAYSSPIWYRP